MAKSPRPKKFEKSNVRNSRATVSGPAAADASGEEATPSVLYDALIIASGAATQLRADGRSLEFNKDQYRHCKPILAFGDGAQLLDACGIPSTLASGEPDEGLILVTDEDGANDQFIAALATHRHFARESDPPRV